MKSRVISLRVTWNPKTGSIACPPYVELANGEFIRNPVCEILEAYQAVKLLDPEGLKMISDCIN